MRLHAFFRSGTSHRLRIALNLKGLRYAIEAVDLRTGQHRGAAYRAVHPQGLVPALTLDDGEAGGPRTLIQSPAILEWLEERHPTPPLLPADPEDRATVRALAAVVACDVHPVNNKRILDALRRDFGADEAAVQRWCERWIAEGFDALEAMLAADDRRGRYCFGDTPTLADVTLVPQVESARRFKVDVSRWPRIAAVDAACHALEAFRAAAPAMQADAP